MSFTASSGDVQNSIVDELLRSVEHEAAAAGLAAPQLTDPLVGAALRRAADLLDANRGAVLEANAADVAVARDELDEGALDRLVLDDARVSGLRAQLLALAELPPLEREIESWTLENGLSVGVRRLRRWKRSRA